MQINITHTSDWRLTPESKKIVNAFGLDISQNKNIIVRNLDIDLQPGKIHYIHGYSGSGKSSILREIAKAEPDSVYIDSWQKIQIPNLPVIDYFPDVPYEQRIKMLSLCGLNEAWKMITKFSDLSDGEKFRFILYHSVMNGKSLIIIDEFCATLDRLTAKAIANNISKIASLTKMTFVLASTHDDIIPYLAPDVTYFKGFDDIRIEKKKPKKYLRDEFKIRKVSKTDFFRLKRFHYVQSEDIRIHRTLHAFGLFHESDKKTLYGIILYAPPLRAIGARKATFLGTITKNLPPSDRVKYLIENVICMSRVVIHPSIRSIGLAQMLIRETMPKVRSRFVEIISQMLYYQNFCPQPYSNYVKYERMLHASKIFESKSTAYKSVSERTTDPHVKYGYVLYINPRIPQRIHWKRTAARPLGDDT